MRVDLRGKKGISLLLLMIPNAIVVVSTIYMCQYLPVIGLIESFYENQQMFVVDDKFLSYVFYSILAFSAICVLYNVYMCTQYIKVLKIPLVLYLLSLLFSLVVLFSSLKFYGYTAGSIVDVIK